LALTAQTDLAGAAVDQVAGLLTGMLGALTLDTHLALSGHARLVDKDCDLVVDEIVDGHCDGHVETGSGAGAEFTGTWEAVRKGATP